MEETIAAIATPLAAGGIGIVRISGNKAIETADAVFRSKSGKKLSELKPYSACYGHIWSEENLLDECIALVYRAPKSYTGEDAAELSCHGGVQVIRKVLEAVLKAGAKLALPGEFTKRAFLNGRIDLTQAEAVMEMIEAKNGQAVKAAARQSAGALSKDLKKIKEQLFDISADLSAFVDFPEEDIPDLSTPVLEKKLKEIEDKIQRHIEGYEKGRILREGINTVIAGRPNVGKSTLMNRIAGYEKSIVTDIAGTTRDFLEEQVQFAGCVMTLTDTAGIRKTEHPVEKLGVERARSKIETADLLFLVFDASSPLEEADRLLLTNSDPSKSVSILNKCDLESRIDKDYVKKHSKRIVEISAENGAGMEVLEKTVTEMLQFGQFDPGEGILANERQLECAEKALDGIRCAIGALESGITLDAVSTGVEQAVAAIENLTGERSTEEILDRVFEKFCVGK